MEELTRWAKRMPHDPVVMAEQRYLQPRLTLVRGEYLLLLGESKLLSWLPEHQLHALQISPVFHSALPSTSWISTLLETLPLRDNSIDAIVVPYLLEFCAKPLEVLREMVRVLKEEGTLWVLGFHRWHPWCWQYAPRAVAPLYDWQLARLLKEAGLLVLEKRWLFYGALYGIEVKKRVHSLTPLKPCWQKPLITPAWQGAANRKAFS